MNVNRLIKFDFGRLTSVFVVIAGIICGLIAYNVYVSNAVSYLSDDPSTCTNCHIMAPQYATWSHSSHRRITNCNDCHVPHDNVFNKNYFKGKDGLRHATIFTLRNEPQVIFIKQEGLEVVYQNCIRCHADQIKDESIEDKVGNYMPILNDRYCWDCHRGVPHGRVNSLSSVPYARVPLPQSNVPKWLKNIVK